MTSVAFELLINGQSQTVTAEESTPLLYVLRDSCGLKGTRFGCGAAQCGACHVLVDGVSVPSCDTPLWSVQGKAVTTVEGLATAWANSATLAGSQGREATSVGATSPAQGRPELGSAPSGGSTAQEVASVGASTLQQAFIDEQAAQCGYCLSGILITAAALLARHPDPSEDQVRQALDGHLCRCGSHNRIVRAVLRAARSGRGA
jgi:nicotinate dehydrogenase subunit A